MVQINKCFGSKLSAKTPSEQLKKFWLRYIGIFDPDWSLTTMAHEYCSGCIRYKLMKLNPFQQIGL